MSESGNNARRGADQVNPPPAVKGGGPPRRPPPGGGGWQDLPKQRGGVFRSIVADWTKSSAANPR